MSYFCPQCKRKHRPSSSIYKKHLKLKKGEVNEISSDKVLPFIFENLPIVAQRQIDIYLDKILLDRKKAYGRRMEGVYIQQINKIILHETQDSFLLR